MELRPHIEKFRKRFAELETLLSDPKVFDNPQSAQELSREYARLKELVAAGESLLKTAGRPGGKSRAAQNRTGRFRTRR